MPGTIVWFRQDLRLADNPALRAALDRDGPIIPVYIHAPDEEDRWSPGGASQWWLHHSLTALAGSLSDISSRLIVRRGPSFETLRELAEAVSADAIVWNRRYEPAAIERDKRIKSALCDSGLAVTSHNAALLFEPWNVATKQGDPYKVFTPFWKATQTLDEPPRPRDAPAPGSLQPPHVWPDSLDIGTLELLPKIDWAGGLRDTWTPGEKGAAQQLQWFLDEAMRNYKDQRDHPSMLGTSRLSPHLHHGEIGPRQIWHATRDRLKAGANELIRQNAWSYLRQIGWREFAHHLLYHFPKTPEQALYDKYRTFPWRTSRSELEAWQRGRTGYPIVDAGMRQLWRTGWMHNRVRMIVGSFLVKDLLLPWQDGAAWFWDTLVDADLASNTLGWQWIAGCGADAAPYFRVFNPVLQSEKFDPKGAYLRQYLPELAALPDKWIHQPWRAPEDALQAAGVKLGEHYPGPIVDHQQARDRALAALEETKNG